VCVCVSLHVCVCMCVYMCAYLYDHQLLLLQGGWGRLANSLCVCVCAREYVCVCV